MIIEVAPLLADFNGDGYRDMIRVNLAGKSRAFISRGGENGFLKVRLPESVGSLGALVDVEMLDGSKRTQQFTSGEGLASDQSHELIFGLGQASGVKSVIVTFPSGRIHKFGPANSGDVLQLE